MTAVYYLIKSLTVKGNSFGFEATDYKLDLDSAVTEVTEQIDVKDIFVERPRSKSSRNLYSSNTIILPLKRIEWTFTIKGELTNDTDTISGLTQNGNAVVNTGINKKLIMQAMGEQGGQLLFGHRNFGANRPVDSSHPDNKSATEENVALKSLVFVDTQTEVGTSETYMKTGESRIAFTLMLRKGSERGT